MQLQQRKGLNFGNMKNEILNFVNENTNAKLIAAAPELLEALEKAKQFILKCKDWNGQDHPSFIDEAITKATNAH